MPAIFQVRYRSLDEAQRNPGFPRFPLRSVWATDTGPKSLLKGWRGVASKPLPPHIFDQRVKFGASVLLDMGQLLFNDGFVLTHNGKVPLSPAMIIVIVGFADGNISSFSKLIFQAQQSLAFFL